MVKKSITNRASSWSGKTAPEPIATLEDTPLLSSENKIASALKAFGERLGGLDFALWRDAKPIDAADFGPDQLWLALQHRLGRACPGHPCGWA